MWNRRWIIWRWKMLRQNFKLIDGKWGKLRSHTRLKKESSKKTYKVTIINPLLTNTSLKLVKMIHTNNMEKLSHKFMKWLRKNKKMILNKLWSIKCGKRNFVKTQKLRNTQKSMRNTWCKKMPRISCSVQSDKIFLIGTNTRSQFQISQQNTSKNQNHMKRAYRNLINLFKNLLNNQSKTRLSSRKRILRKF